MERSIDLDDEPLRLRCEQAIRNHDPCISCSTHSSTSSSSVVEGKQPPVLILEVGNELRGDDAAGIAVARRIGNSGPAFGVAEALSDAVADALPELAERVLSEALE